MTLRLPPRRWGNDGDDRLWHHEVYNAGCLAEAGVHCFPAEAVGHSVRALLCHTGLTAFCREAAEPAYEQAAGRLWANVTGRKMHVSGGVGTIRQFEGFFTFRTTATSTSSGRSTVQTVNWSSWS